MRFSIFRFLVFIFRFFAIFILQIVKTFAFFFTANLEFLNREFHKNEVLLILSQTEMEKVKTNCVKDASLLLQN